MEQKREINKKLSWVFTVISIGELAGALAVVAYGLLKGHMTGTTCNVIMGAALVLYWLLEDIAEPFAVHRFDGITQAQKEAYVKYIILDLVGFAGIACFLFGVGGSSSGSNSGILGAVVYVVVMKPKRQNQQIFYGHIDPDAESGEDKRYLQRQRSRLHFRIRMRRIHPKRNKSVVLYGQKNSKHLRISTCSVAYHETRASVGIAT